MGKWLDGFRRCEWGRMFWVKNFEAAIIVPDNILAAWKIRP
jgi:hypothetical protein